MNIIKDASRKILTGNWGHDIAWEFYISNEVPPLELCTSVMCVAMTGSNEFVLTHNHRGWELPGGHIEPGESVEEALTRELMEEVGFTPDVYRLFGYRKLIPRIPIPHAQQEGFYPFPVGYMPYFVATTSVSLCTPTGDPAEILGAGVFSLDEVGGVREEFMHIAAAGQRAMTKL